MIAAPAHTIARGTVLNALTVDVEDYFQVEAFAKVVPREEWDRLPQRVERNTERLLELFDVTKVKGTFFILGWVAERYPRLVARIAAAGHEIASHGYAHRRADLQSRAEFRDDVTRAKAIIEDAAGASVRGFRAATFSIARRNWWAFEVLAETGHAYSSSIFPIAHDLYGMPDCPRAPFRVAGSAMLEIPLTTVRWGGRNLPCAGGGYFRLLPYSFSRWAMRRVNRDDRMPCIFYMHPWEIDPDQPRQEAAPLKSRLRHYTNLAAMEGRLRRLLGDFRWGRMDETFADALASGTRSEAA